MGMVAGLVCDEKKYSYQHIQGVMLVNLNNLAYELNLSHSTYRVAGFLISNYNINSNTAYPSIETIAKACCMSKSTVIKSIEILVNNGLIIALKESGKLARYSFTKKLLAELTGTSCETSTSTACETPHDMKQIKKEPNKTSNDISSIKAQAKSRIIINYLKNNLEHCENTENIKSKKLYRMDIVKSDFLA